MTVGDARRRRHAFATAPFAKSKVVSDGFVMEPTSTVHAKEMGTTLTLCGQSSTTWFKFWDIPFRDVRRNRCATCVEQFAAASPKQQRPDVALAVTLAGGVGPVAAR
jgi:hypothetical protein